MACGGGDLMTHTFMYPQGTQIARRAHGVPASWLLPGRPARGTGDLFGPLARLAESLERTVGAGCVDAGHQLTAPCDRRASATSPEPDAPVARISGADLDPGGRHRGDGRRSRSFAATAAAVVAAALPLSKEAR